jgi:hypothetical protein
MFCLRSELDNASEAHSERHPGACRYPSLATVLQSAIQSPAVMSVLADAVSDRG